MDVRQIINLIELLEFYAQRQRPATLTEVANHFGWPRSSTFNLVTTLVNRGYLYEPKAKEGFYPSPRWRDIIAQVEEGMPSAQRLHNLLESLVLRTNETAALCGISAGQVIFIDVVESPQAVRYTVEVGRRVPLHASATGRALLSQLSSDSRAALLRKAVFERHTPNTVHFSAASVEEEIDRSLKRGWFENHSEYSNDLSGSAIPLPMDSRQLAVLVAGPASRIAGRHAEIAHIITDEIQRMLARPS